jgi:3-oxoacyl-[acyl-carrier-protein] synthase II
MFWDSLSKGVSGIGPVRGFDTSGVRPNLGGEVEDFRPQDILGPKGLRLLDRPTKLSLSAAALALEDAGLKITDNNSCDVGVALGTNSGSIASRTSFIDGVIKKGPKGVNPALFPNTVLNSSASQISIRFGIKGFNTTLSAGFASSFEAFGYAADAIRLNSAKAVLAGGVEELCEFAYSLYARTGFLSGSAEGEAEISAPFDSRRNGAVLGEGSAILIFEDLEHALGRGARIYAEYKGGGTVLDHASHGRYSPDAKGGGACIRAALNTSGLESHEIDLAVSGANSTIDGDRAEAGSLSDTLGPACPVTAVKSMTGETLSASGALMASAAVMSIDRGIIPPTVNYEKRDASCSMDSVSGSARQKSINNAIVFTTSPMMHNSALVLSKFDTQMI